MTGWPPLPIHTACRKLLALDFMILELVCPFLERRKLRLRAAETKHKLGHGPVSYFSPALHYSTFISSPPASFSFEHTCTHTHTHTHTHVILSVRTNTPVAQIVTHRKAVCLYREDMRRRRVTPSTPQHSTSLPNGTLNLPTCCFGRNYYHSTLSFRGKC